MAYIVVYQANDGSAGYEPTTDLDSAIQTAERLRNLDGVDDPRIFKTEEVHIDFRPYYRVQVSGDADSGSPAAVEQVAPVEQAPPEPVQAAAPVQAVAPAVEAEPVAAAPVYAQESEVAEAPAPAAPIEPVVPSQPLANSAPVEVVDVDDVIRSDDVEFDAEGNMVPRRGLFGR